MLRLFRVRKRFDAMRIEDVEASVAAAMQTSSIPIRDGASIAVAVGSRGIANIARITRAVVERLRSAGARPFIVPAMGSHGGATAEGQAALLASYGITERAMGCPIRSSMEVVELDGAGLENRLFMDRHASEADGVVVINRIKPHTDFHARFESGLVKMIVIGLGKEAQAYEIHRYGVRGLRDLVPRSAERILATGKILAGIAIVENAYDETSHLQVLPAAEIMSKEPELLNVAKKQMPRLPVDDIDVLIVDRLGKNISGTGMDTNIIGRIRIAGEPEPESPRIKSIIVRDLTPESHGNATGMGLADVITGEFRSKIDFEITNKNVLTSGFLERGKMPYVAASEAEALEVALRNAGCRDTTNATIVRIKDTLHLGEMLVSRPVLETATALEPVGDSDGGEAIFDPKL